MVTTVFDASATLAGTDDGDGNNNFNMRQAFKALSSATGTQLRATVLWGTAEGTETPALDDMWVGQGPGGSAGLFNGNQVQLKFGGSSSLNGSAAGGAVSDWVTLGETFDNTKIYLISCHFVGATSNISFGSVANVDQIGCTTAGASTASQTSPSPAMNFVNGNTIAFITKIEIQAAAPPPTATPGGTLSMMGVG